MKKFLISIFICLSLSACSTPPKVIKPELVIPPHLKKDCEMPNKLNNGDIVEITTKLIETKKLLDLCNLSKKELLEVIDKTSN